MTAPVVPTLPAYPTRNDPPDTFIAKADAHLAAMPGVVIAQNDLGAWMNDTAAQVAIDAGTASTKAGESAASASAAADQVTLAASFAQTAISAPGTSATSTTSLTVGKGSQALTIQPGKDLVAGMWIVCADTAAPGTNYMAGPITAYDSGTGALTFTAVAVGGSGTIAAWTVSLTAVGGATLGPNTFTAAQDYATGEAIASAATINLDAATGNRVHITGTTTITAVTLTRGPRTVIFDGVLLLTHHATNNNLPGAANITTAAGDRAVYESDGTTVYCTSYVRADGAALISTSVGDHAVVVHTGNGSGSVATTIRRYTTVMTNVGTAITYADSATDGASFTINEDGIYAMYSTDKSVNSGLVTAGASVNSSELTTAVENIAIATRLFFSVSGYLGGYWVSGGATRRLSAGDVVRPHHIGGETNTTSSTYFSIRKVGK